MRPSAVPPTPPVRSSASRTPLRWKPCSAPGLHISPTRFEKYQYCPFGYFLQYILKATPRQKAELAPNISGTLTHWVLENALRRQGEAFKDLTPEELETLVNDLVDEYTAANLPGMTLRMEYLVGASAAIWWGCWGSSSAICGSRLSARRV